MMFADRRDAGRRLAALLEHLRGPDLVVLGLPGGGVPVAYEVARALGAPLDAIVVRKLGVPVQPELAMGALGEDGVRVLNESVVHRAGVDAGTLAEVERAERAALDRRVRRLRGGRAPVPLRGRVALIVDDGIATGSTARAACAVARAHGARRVVLAAPVAPPSALRSFAPDADEVVCALTPEWFAAVGEWYADFSHVTDEEVCAVLARTAGDTGTPDGRRPRVARPAPGGDPVEVTVHAGGALLPGTLTVPADPRGVVVFAHGSGSGRHSPRNRYVAGTLHRARIGTLLFDLLTEPEATSRGPVFDIAMLAARLSGALHWLRARPGTPGLPVGLFGASTGAAAALWAAAGADAPVAAVVSRGGRPDLAGSRLAAVTAPTLLIVGERDELVVELNRAALAALRCPRRLTVIPGATHLFEEPGTLRAASETARDWFVHHFRPAGDQVHAGP